VKRCRICKETKPFDAFYAMNGMRDGYRNECKACNLAERAAKYAADSEMQSRARERVRKWQAENRERYLAKQAQYKREGKLKIAARKSHLKRTFGITPEEYEARLAEQGGGCAVCGRAPKAGKSLHVDHDHESGYVRGLLCFSCNAALGHFQDDLDRIDAALMYVATKRRVSALRLAR
jgi:hypothetical protein